ncbi:hypothetical protein KCTCHS21_31040 [Cohnella abietis]|uniref:Beta-lactamase-related domain-containing protein n=2 Tax=Cohnella abietis TaxID=2507935 RepID=A0A3T1D6K2_9BACL|nr:hypothetical protein KCTCHS21_31040 [Cohnella abietis]
MTTGWDWPEWGEWDGMPRPMIDSPDWVSFVLSRPMKDEPGTRMIYNSGCSQLLSAILQKVTGMTTAQYAEQFLFKPLGIQEYLWHADANGITIGGFSLSLKAADLMKLGQLMLSKGRIADVPIVPEDWIDKSVAPRFHTYDDVGSYGYHWWILSNQSGKPVIPTTYFAMGFGGQYIFIVPEQQLIVTFASSLYKQSFLPYQLFKELVYTDSV